MRTLLLVLLALALSDCGGLSWTTVKNSPGAVVNHVESRSLTGAASATVTNGPSTGSGQGGAK